MYCSIEDLKKALPERVLLQLADDENDGEFVIVPPNAAYSRIVDAITRADTLIDGYVCGRYTLPFLSVPALIKNISVNLAICELYARSHDAIIPEGIAERRKSNIKILENLQRGTVLLPGQTKEEPAAVFTVNKTDDDREFPDSLLRQY